MFLLFVLSVEFVIINFLIVYFIISFAVDLGFFEKKEH